VSERFAQWFRFLCKFGIPFILAFLAVGMLTDRINRWPVAASVLSKYPDQTATLIAFRYRFAGDDWTRSATYILFPSLRSIEITVSNGARPLIRESPYGLFGAATTLFWIAVAVGLSAWHWRHTPDAAPPNNRWRGP
jgi:hypothetical protein